MESEDAADDTGRSPQVKVRLSTRHTDIAIPENVGPILVNTNFRRYALSTLVNTLRQSEKTVPFDFLINGSFLRASLDDYLTTNGLSTETTLAVEYIRAIVPPLFVANYEHNDWVSHVDVLSASSYAVQRSASSEPVARGSERILSASYDGYIRVWNSSSEIIATSPSATEGDHQSSVKAARFIDRAHIASCGLDRTVRIWKFVENAPESQGFLQPQLELYGHKSSVDALDADASFKRVLTASSDHSVGLWSTKKADAPPAPASLIPSSTGQRIKRRKIAPATSSAQRGPLSMLRGHGAPVADVKFAPNDATVAYSGSWDHSLRTWDLTTSSCVDQRAISSSIFSVATLPSLSLVAAGTSARQVALIDPRANAASIIAMTLRGHKNAVVSLAPSPTNSYGLVSGSHDGTCRIWDVRSAKTEQEGRIGESSYIIERQSAKGKGRRVAEESSKVFSVTWDRDVGILSGGEDKMVQINQGGDAAAMEDIQ